MRKLRLFGVALVLCALAITSLPTPEIADGNELRHMRNIPLVELRIDVFFRIVRVIHSPGVLEEYEPLLRDTPSNVRPGSASEERIRLSERFLDDIPPGLLLIPTLDAQFNCRPSSLERLIEALERAVIVLAAIFPPLAEILHCPRELNTLTSRCRSYVRVKTSGFQVQPVETNEELGENLRVADVVEWLGDQRAGAVPPNEARSMSAE